MSSSDACELGANTCDCACTASHYLLFSRVEEAFTGDLICALVSGKKNDGIITANDRRKLLWGGGLLLVPPVPLRQLFRIVWGVTATPSISALSEGVDSLWDTPPHGGGANSHALPASRSPRGPYSPHSDIWLGH